MQVERILPTVDAALRTVGRTDQRVLAWLAAQPDVNVTHVGDYDPVGLSEYQRVRAAFGDRAQFRVPKNLEELVARYGQVLLLEYSGAVYQHLGGLPGTTCRPHGCSEARRTGRSRKADPLPPVGPSAAV